MGRGNEGSAAPAPAERQPINEGGMSEGGLVPKPQNAVPTRSQAGASAHADAACFGVSRPKIKAGPMPCWRMTARLAQSTLVGPTVAPGFCGRRPPS